MLRIALLLIVATPFFVNCGGETEEDSGVDVDAGIDADSIDDADSADEGDADVSADADSNDAAQSDASDADGVNADADAEVDADPDAEEPGPVEEPGPDFACEPTLTALGIGTSAGRATPDGEITQHIWFDSADSASVRLAIELYAYQGGPTEPGTYPVTAAEESYATCGLCIQMIRLGTAKYMPLADSGTITIDELIMGAEGEGTEFSGSFDLVLREVTIDETLATTPVEGGCSERATFSWSGPIVIL